MHISTKFRHSCTFVTWNLVTLLFGLLREYMLNASTHNMIFFESTVEKIVEFYKQAVMPELLGKWYTKMPVMPLVSSNSASTTVQWDNFPPKDVWCYCKQLEDDRAMIGCDYPECPIQ